MVLRRIRNLGLALLIALAASSCFASSSATLLLEEPYGKLGFFTGTGHAAVYLSGVCADTPVHLRTCHLGETGVVISRYDGVGKYDWVAVPLIPYLYAVESPDDVPLFADAKMVAFLRDHYRRKHLEAIAPDVHDGEVPGGNWYELVGTSYDRTVYGFEIATTPEKDKALIEKLNASANQSHFRTVSSNCADFAKDIINFYYPKALHRSVIADVGITTPKQMAKMLTKFSAHHPEIDSSRLVIGQVPGSMPRSTTAHGVVESFFKSKKYIVPSAVVSPIFAGCVAAVYVGTGAGRFEPARDAMVYVVNGEPERPLDAEDRRAYREELKHLASASPKLPTDHSWGKLQSKATATVDKFGRPVLEFATDEGYVRLGVSASNLFDGSAPPQMIRELLQARLHSELNHRPAVTLTETEVARDWRLFQQATEETEPHFTRTALHSEMLRANAP